MVNQLIKNKTANLLNGDINVIFDYKLVKECEIYVTDYKILSTSIPEELICDYDICELIANFLI